MSNAKEPVFPHPLSLFVREGWKVHSRGQGGLGTKRWSLVLIIIPRDLVLLKSAL